MLVWKLWTVYACMFEVTAILSCVIKIRDLFKSTKWRHFENVKYEALSARHAKHDILLPNRTVLGRIELVHSVTPVEVKFKEWLKAQTEHKLESEPTDSKPQVTTSEPPPHIKGIDLGDLSEEQHKLAIDMLTEEQDSFARDDNDISMIQDLKLEINLEDKTPVQRTI